MASTDRTPAGLQVEGAISSTSAIRSLPRVNIVAS